MIEYMDLLLLLILRYERTEPVLLNVLERPDLLTDLVRH